ncbi:MAG: hypothetical protein ACD_83C00039G0001 [uncultured bacterium]|nr:MAG: hypothetical protein ACD_83C00039G0001 [uncultured bacterium]
MKNFKITTPLVILALIIIICVGVYLVYALVVDRSVGSTATNSTANTTSSAEKECLAKGGEWEKIGMGLSKQCNMTFSDANKKCTDSSECQGQCIAENPQSIVGKCSSRSSASIGCHSLMMNGKASPTLCLD